MNEIKIFAQTERLIIREILPSDAEGMFELDSDPDVHTYLGNKPVTDKAQVSTIIQSIRKQYTDFGIGRWAVIDKTSQEFIGWTGLKFVTELTNNHQNYYDIGYRLKKKFWRQGIATETAIISRDYAFNTLNLPELYAAANIENVGSNAILQNIGMKCIETFYYDDIL